ncbi:outer membrane protein OmpK [Halomonas koreensis]|uniref:Outer membrane protein OmpK n=1 Tax=Halomonas koreensis TaxID=245385 RepID=A0ABU1FXQ9_9GAMM|nr:outer membrane protein OmpK [Halomonas koreensis]MDR5865470.1 outer membrane protein OmpK [Halomonas koreensis]
MHTKTKLTLATAAASLLVAQGASAALYSTTQVEALYGWGYEDTAGAGFNIDNEDHAILTVVNATGWTYGDSFFFADFTNLDQGTQDEQDHGSTHAEWGLRGNIGKTTGLDLSAGPLENLYVIGQLDLDRNSSTRKTTHLAGLSADFDVPGFAFVKLHAMYRNDDSDAAEGSSEQYTLVWNAPFTIGGADFTFEGFLDYITEEGDLEQQLLTQPQLVWHATEHLGIGIEYQHWENKFGLEDTDESLPQAMVRWTF